LYSEEGDVSRDMEVVLLTDGRDRLPLPPELSGGSDTPRRLGDTAG
jgi:hypothetical protein